VPDAEDEAKTQTCADCGAVSPPISTNYTLIGTHGWRITRRATTDGALVVEWRCPDCWIAHKRASRPDDVAPDPARAGRSIAKTVKVRGPPRRRS